MATAQTELLTAEQYRLLPDPGQPAELVRGTIIMMSNPGARHGYVCNRIGRLLGALVQAQFGKGQWVYVGLGLWRELPAGVDGAYQLLANLVALGRTSKLQPPAR